MIFLHFIASIKVECHPFSTGTLFCLYIFFLSKRKEVAFVVAFAPASAPQSPVTPTAVHHAGACHWRPTSASACRWNLVTVFLPIYFINRFPAVVCLDSTGGGRRRVKCTKSKTKQTSRPKANKRARSLSLCRASCGFRRTTRWMRKLFSSFIVVFCGALFTPKRVRTRYVAGLGVLPAGRGRWPDTPRRVVIGKASCGVRAGFYATTP